MIKLINYRCARCGAEIEEFRGDDEPVLVNAGRCECGGTMRRFNAKNNGQRYQFMDRGDGTNLAYDDV